MSSDAMIPDLAICPKGKKDLFWLRHVACRILVPWPEIEPVPPAVEAKSKPTGLPVKSQNNFFRYTHLRLFVAEENKESI